MLLRDMARQAIDFGTYARGDGEEFAISGVLYESPQDVDFWLIPITVLHPRWHQMRFTLTVPKKIANSVALVRTLARGEPLAHVKSLLEKATESGRNMDLIWSTDGWVLT